MLQTFRLALILFTLGACALPSERSEIDAYRELLDTPALDEKEPTEPLTVVRAMQIANATNERLGLEGERYLQSLIERRRRASVFLPTFSFAPTFTYRDQTTNSEGISAGSELLDVQAQGAFLLSPVQDLFSALAAASTAEERAFLLRSAQDALLLDTARAFIEAKRAEQTVQVLKNSLALQEIRGSDMRARLDVGSAKLLDVSLTETQTSATRIELLNAGARVNNSRLLLEFLTTVPLADTPLSDEYPTREVFSNLEEAIAQAESTRPEVLSAAYAIDAASYTVKEAYGRYFPAVSINAAYFFDRETSPTDRDWSSLIQVSIPLFTAGLIEADVRTALSQLRQAKYRYSLLQRDIRREVSTAWINVQTSADRMNETVVQEQSSTQAFEQADALYTVGLATNLERLVAQQTLLNAQLESRNAALDNIVAYFELLRAMGKLHEVIGMKRPMRNEVRNAQVG